MFPGPFHLFGVSLVPWNLLLLTGILAGLGVLLRTPGRMAGARASAFLVLRYGVIVYVCAIAAQWFAYLFDSGTTVLPPPDFGALRYYLHPLAGPKTLYGSILALPAGVALAYAPASRGTIGSISDQHTPALMTVLGFARIGCFLQGCCYGLRSDAFGVSFPVGSAVHADQALSHLVGVHEPSLRVLPVQLLSAAACFTLAAWSYRRTLNGKPHVFVSTIVSYSVFRFVVEFFRSDEARNQFGALSTSQWIALLIICSVALRSRYDATRTPISN